LLLLTGCSRQVPPAVGCVRGTVTFQGRPLAGGLIVFAPDRDKGNAGKPACATIAADGSYELPDPPAAGWYKVALADPPGVFQGEWGLPRFPTALRRPDRSGLEREVKAGHQHVMNFAVEVPQ
jgi:hypothetical protein